MGVESRVKEARRQRDPEVELSSPHLCVESRVPHMGQCHLHLGSSHLNQLNLETPSLLCPEVCLFDDSRSFHINHHKSILSI